MRTSMCTLYYLSIALLALVSCATGATCSLASTTATGYIGYNFTGVFSKDGSLSGDLDYVPFPYKCGIHYSSGTWSEDSTAATVTLSLSRGGQLLAAAAAAVFSKGRAACGGGPIEASRRAAAVIWPRGTPRTQLAPRLRRGRSRAALREVFSPNQRPSAPSCRAHTHGSTSTDAALLSCGGGYPLDPCGSRRRSIGGRAARGGGALGASRLAAAGVKKARGAAAAAHSCPPPLLSGCQRSSCTLAPACNGNYDLTLSRVQWAADCRSFNCTLTATTSDVTVFTVTPAPASTVNKAVIIGLIVGALVAGCVLIFCCCWCCNRSSSSRRRQGGAGYGQLNNNGAPMPVNGTASYVPPSYTPTPGAPMTPPAPQVMSPQQQQPYRATTGALPGGPQAMPPRAVTAPAPAGHPVVYAGVPMGAQVPPPMYAAAPPAYAPAYAAAPPPMAYAPPAAPSGYAPSAPPSGEAPPPGYFDAPPPMTSPYGSGVEKQ